MYRHALPGGCNPNQGKEIGFEEEVYECMPEATRVSFMDAIYTVTALLILERSQ